MEARPLLSLPRSYFVFDLKFLCTGSPLPAEKLEFQVTIVSCVSLVQSHAAYT